MQQPPTHREYGQIPICELESEGEDRLRRSYRLEAPIAALVERNLYYSSESELEAATIDRVREKRQVNYAPRIHARDQNRAPQAYNELEWDAYIPG